MRNAFNSSLVVLALASGCSETGFEPYYESRHDPVVPLSQGELIGSEIGNAGGNVVTISGSGFGDDPDEIMVLLGNHNARIISTSDAELVVETPVGPITGGRVNLVIGTKSGYLEVPQAYEYDIRQDHSAPDPYTRQENYILVQNFWNSCLGGMGTGGGCEQVAYIGETGIDAQAEFFDFYYPRVQTAYAGFVTTADSSADWRVYRGFDQPFPSGIEDLRKPVGNFKLINEHWLGESTCIALGDNKAESCTGSDVREYDLGELQFCEGIEPGAGPTARYAADWPLVHNFFEGPQGDAGPVTVRIQGAADEDLNGISLTLPGTVAVRGDLGFTSPDSWAISAMAACGDANGDGEALLDEDGVVLSWEPISAELGGDNVTTVTSYIHVSMSLMTVGWFSVDGYGLRASIVVPDDHGFDPATGRASIGIPNSVLYQFPSPNTTWTTRNDITKTGSLGTSDSRASYMLLELLRVTDYRIESPTGEVTVFSYVTGDLSFPSWKNPAEGTGCFDCLDGDGDGWVDALDPDCNTAVGGNGVFESGENDVFTCSDGIDNDDDIDAVDEDGNSIGGIDADDPDCLNGWSGETNCGNGIDDDGDGWIDGLDGECPADDPFASERGDDDPSWLCSDGIDNDGDGWIDAQDPGCADGTGTDEGGFSDLPCNDGIDNDGDGLIDADDPYCAVVGARAEAEAPELKSQCIDGLDNDGDGFVDALDPDCELPAHTREVRKFMDPSDTTGAWYGLFTVPECYDGLDNDGDGVADAADPSCWDPTLNFAPDGFRRSESAQVTYPSGHPNAGEVTGCTDGLDGDGDGWIDGEDPDCAPNDAGTQEEVGFGPSACNDGIDNDGDGKIDRDDEGCSSARDNNEF